MEPLLGLIFIAPGVAAVFAVIGALFGFASSLLGYLLYRATGGRLGSNKVNLPTRGGFRGAMANMGSPVMMGITGTLSLLGTWVGMGWWYDEWSPTAQLTMMSGQMFQIQEPGPTLLIFAAMVGLYVGRLLGNQIYPRIYPRTPSYLPGSGPTAVARENALATPGGGPNQTGLETGARETRRLGYTLGRWACTMVGLVVVSYAALAVNYGTALPRGVAQQVSTWFQTKSAARLELPTPSTDEAPDPRTPPGAVARPGEWPTYRGGYYRTGSVAGPASPVAGKLAWAYGVRGSSIAYLSSPAVVGDYVLVGGSDGGVGGALFTFHLPRKANPAEQLHSIDLQKIGSLPVFSPPAVSAGQLYVGEGMHEHTATKLRRLDLAADPASGKRLVWELPVASHTESGPAVVGERLYLGAGDVGVLCVATDKIAKPAQTDDDTGVTTPAEPVVHWQQRFADVDGKFPLHCDTSPAVVGDRVIASSGRFREHDGRWVGDSCVVALSTRDGSPIWRYQISPPSAQRPLNPWGSPTVVGDTVLVGCGDCRLDPKQIPTSLGAVFALDLATGKLKWRTDTAGAVLSSVAVVPTSVNSSAASGPATPSSLVLCSARSITVLSLADGRPTSTIEFAADSGTRFMTSPTVADNRAYTVDMQGVVRAHKIIDGKLEQLWRLDLNIAVGAPVGLVYSAPSLANGRLYMGTDSGWFLCVGEP